MRSVAAVLAMLAALVAAFVPCHRCAPVGSEGAGVTVFVGCHAHEGHGDPCCDPSDEPSEPCGHSHDTDGEPCCVDAPADPVTAPSSAVDVAITLVDAGAWFVDDVARVAGRDPAAWQPPVPRPPTETTVLLR
jgi:hypothetical protein